MHFIIHSDNNPSSNVPVIRVILNKTNLLLLLSLIAPHATKQNWRFLANIAAVIGHYLRVYKERN